MKLWIFSTIWKHLSKYWSQFAPFKSQNADPNTRQVKLTEIKTKSLTSSTKKKGRQFKFNPKDFSDSSELLPTPSVYKTKSILKRNNKTFRKISRKDVRVEPDKMEVQKMCDSFGDEISSIDEKRSQGSSTTVKKILHYLGDESFLSMGCQFDNRDFKRESPALRRALWQPPTNHHMLPKMRDTSSKMKCAFNRYNLSSVNEEEEPYSHDMINAI